jgi:hypothetical protein
MSAMTLHLALTELRALVYHRRMRWPFCLIPSFLLCAIPHAACSQTFYGVSGGFGYATNPGFLAEASFGQLKPFGQLKARGSGWRVDAFATGSFQGEYTKPFVCPPGAACVFPRPATMTATYSLVVAGLAASVLIPLRASATGSTIYAVVGGEADRLLGAQGTPRNVLFGASPGLGIAFGPDARGRTFVEARLHGMIYPAGFPTWVLFVSAGMQWSLTRS